VVETVVKKHQGTTGNLVAVGSRYVWPAVVVVAAAVVVFQEVVDDSRRAREEASLAVRAVRPLEEE
jgi:hypothetical protein